MAQTFNATVHKFILDSFDDGEFRSFCYDHFGPSVKLFSEGMPFDQKVIRFLSYVHNQNQIGRMRDRRYSIPID